MSLFLQDATDIGTFIDTKGQLQPFLLVAADEHRAYLVVDSQIIKGCPQSEDYALLLTAAYFIYNIQYAKGTHNLYTFFELLFFEKTCNAGKLSVTVKNLYTVIKNMSS